MTKPAGCILVVLAVLGSAGCRRSTTAEQSRREVAEAFGQLPGLTETPDPELRVELARIIEEEGTPELLARSEIADEENVAQGLANLFTPSQLQAVLDRAIAGSAQLLLVAGYSGVGKTSLVHEIERDVVAKQAIFVEGKFDQL